ncbi:MAG: adenylate/guanylate cyclase domain-containing protein, partial [Gammaproteobacteria bacterium]|nr:adenylate/guanylate cyclase domain-containing protein [Gammaproteobacteria bacterium]
MTPNTHRLAAILFADIVGYSRLMGEDQADTLVLLARFREIVEDHIAREDGRVVEHIGDQVFASFDSAQAAVKAGLGLQNALAEFNAAEAGRAEDRRLQSRVGIHLGEVVEKDGDLFGDGVNVAARLESMAPPDWLCISGVVRDQLTDTSGITLIPLGRQPLKNIRHKVNVFLAAPAGLSATARWRAHYQYRFGRRWGRPLGMALGGGALASALVAGILVLRSQPAEAHYLAVSDFRNLAEEGDRGDYFSVGVTEAIRAQLASIPTLYLVDRKQDIGARLRLEGSVQRSAEQVRIVFRLTSKDGETVGGGTVDGS